MSVASAGDEEDIEGPGEPGLVGKKSFEGDMSRHRTELRDAGNKKEKDVSHDLFPWQRRTTNDATTIIDSCCTVDCATIVSIVVRWIEKLESSDL